MLRVLSLALIAAVASCLPFDDSSRTTLSDGTTLYKVTVRNLDSPFDTVEFPRITVANKRSWWSLSHGEMNHIYAESTDTVLNVSSPRGWTSQEDTDRLRLTPSVIKSGNANVVFWHLWNYKLISGAFEVRVLGTVMPKDSTEAWVLSWSPSEGYVFLDHGPVWFMLGKAKFKDQALLMASDWVDNH